MSRRARSGRGRYTGKATRGRVIAVHFSKHYPPTTEEVAAGLKLTPDAARALLEAEGMRSAPCTVTEGDTTTDTTAWDLGGVVDLFARRGLPVILTD